MRVDLPEPDGPMMATYSPSSIVKLTPRRAATEMDPVRYTFVTRSSSMTRSRSGFDRRGTQRWCCGHVRRA